MQKSDFQKTLGIILYLQKKQIKEKIYLKIEFIIL